MRHQRVNKRDGIKEKESPHGVEEEKDKTFETGGSDKNIPSRIRPHDVRAVSESRLKSADQLALKDLTTN